MTLTVSAQVGHSDIEVAEFLDHVTSIFVNKTDLVAGVYRYALPLGSVVLNVRAIVVTSFDGGATLQVGDSGSVHGYLETTDLNPTAAAGTMAQSYQSGLEDAVSGVTAYNAYSKGKAYPTTAPLIVVTVGGSPTVGKLRLDFVLAGRDMVAGPKDLINNFS